ncbi:MAG: AmmeMemoRadiSam system protein B [Patescibacteria group bacterium]|jgi:poly-gamma-glutamate synthesis protein (capsule biosynthesis protein)
MRSVILRIIVGISVVWLLAIAFLFGQLCGSCPTELEPIGEIPILSAVSPHHLLAIDGITDLFSVVGSLDVKTVVVISPNHFSTGHSPAQISLGSWPTPYGDLETDQNAVEKLLADVSVLKNEEKTFEKEHGVTALTPFIKEYFPNAKIVALAIHDKLSAEEAKVLTEAIANDLPSAFVIGSADMSHYLPHYAAIFHDEITERTIARGCQDELCQVDLEVDSNNVISMLMQINRARGTEIFSLTGHTDALTLTGSDNWEENTSHLLGYFTKGEPADDDFISLHFVGDIMLDRGTRKQIDAADDVGYPWAKMDRFLDGTDFVVGNLEGTVNEQPSTYTYDPPFRFVFDPTYVEEAKKYLDAVSLANNHASDVGSAGELETHTWLEKIGLPWLGSYLNSTMRYDTTIGDWPISFIGYHAFQPNEKALLAEIAAAKADGNFVIVMPHWGTEYVTSPDSSEKRLAKLIVEAGADLVIGGHPHVPQGGEVIGDTPVWYSLGNFVFDQSIPETWTGLTAGVIISDSQIEIHLLPVFTKNSQPTPMSDTAAQKVLAALAETELSSTSNDLKEQIKNGIIIIPRYEENN